MTASSPSLHRLLPARVGVVLLSMGGPDADDALPAFLSLRRKARPSARPWLPEAAHRALDGLLAAHRARPLREGLAHVGGAVPDARLVVELAELVQDVLALDRPGTAWTVVPATACGTPSLAAAAARLADEQVDRIVVVPLVSVWVDSLSGPLVEAWQQAQHAAGLGAVPVDLVRGFADVPGYVDALGERVSEALQRFPRATRDGVHVVFALHPASAGAGIGPSPLHAVAARVGAMLPVLHHTAFAPLWGERTTATPSLEDTLTALVRAGERRLLVAPIGFVHETMDTAYELDVVQRAYAESLGVVQFEVAACLNLHETFVRTLGQAVCGALGVPETVRPHVRAA